MTFPADPAAETWIIVADGARARILQETRRYGPLETVEEIDAPDEPRHRGHQRGTVFERAGGGRHGVTEVSPADVAEQAFLKDIARRLREGATARKFKSLVLIAPPKALGALRSGLSEAERLVEVSDPHDRTREGLEAIRGRVRELRTPA